MRLRYLDTDFFARGSANVAAASSRSILHVCGIHLQDFDHPPSPLPEIVLEEARQRQIEEAPLPELGSGSCPESTVSLRGKLLRDLLPFKRESGQILLDGVRPADSTAPRQPFVLEIPEVSEDSFSIREIFDAQQEISLGDDEDFAVLDRQASVLQIEPVEFQSSIVSLADGKKKFRSSFRQVFALETGEVDLLELSASSFGSKEDQDQMISWDPCAIALDLAIEPIDLELMKKLVAPPQLFDNLVLRPTLTPPPSLPAMDQQGRIEESLFESSNFSIEVPRLESKQVGVPDPELDREDTVTEMVDSLGLAMQHVELELLSELPAAPPQLYQKLVIDPELSLRCHHFKTLPVPGFYSGDKPEKVEEFVFGALASLAKCSQPSATNFIYLDWHLSEGNACNDHRCFYFRSRHPGGVPDKIGLDLGADDQAGRIDAIELAFDQTPVAAKLTEEHLALDLIKPPTSDANRSDPRRRSGIETGSKFAPRCCTGIFVVNSRLVDKYGLISRRSTYQKILALEKAGAQVVERELRLPIDVILGPTRCLVFYNPDKLGLPDRATGTAESISASIESIIDNDMKAISFAFQQCVMIFEGDRRFTTGVLQTVDDIYAAAVGLSIQVQCFVSSNPGNTDSIVLSLVNGSVVANSPTYPRMTEAPTVAEAFLTESPAVNPLTAHAILSSGKTLSTFIAMPPPDQLAAAKPFAISAHSLQLFKAQCEFGQSSQCRVQQPSNFGARYRQGMEPDLLVGQCSSTGHGQHSKGPSVRDRSGGQSESNRRSPQRTRADESFQMLKGQADDLEPLLEPSQGIEVEDSVRARPYFPSAAELDEEWDCFTTPAPRFPPAEQLDEDWDESPAMPSVSGFGGAAAAAGPDPDPDEFVNKIATSSDFGFSSNRRQSSSASSVKDALKSWLSAREQSKNSKRPPPAAPPPVPATRTPTPTPTPTSSRKRKDSAAAAASATKTKKKPSNDIFTLWENFKYKNQSQIQGSTPLLATSRSFKRPSSSVFSTSSSTQNNSSSGSIQQQQQRGKRSRRATT